MQSQRRNIPEQEHSIKARSHELFVDETPLPARSTRPFADYLRETPARPLHPGLRAMLWVLGLIVGALFLAAVWRVVHRHGANRPAAGARAESAVSRADRPGPPAGAWPC